MREAYPAWSSRGLLISNWDKSMEKKESEKPETWPTGAVVSEMD